MYIKVNKNTKMKFKLKFFKFIDKKKYLKLGFFKFLLSFKTIFNGNYFHKVKINNMIFILRQNYSK